MKTLPPLTLMVVYLFTFSADADIIHVPGDQPTIQAGIEAAVGGDTVLVDDGTWTGSGNRDLDFTGKAITVMSQHGPEKCIIDCEGNSWAPHCGFRFYSGEGSGSVVRGFTIRNGWAPRGGGISCIDSGPTIVGNIITENSASLEGGGVYCDNAGGVLSGNTIAGNTCIDFDWGNVGGGIHLIRSTTAIINNEISENYTFLGGGGISCYESSPIISGNLITLNEVHYDWGGNNGTGGGGIYLRNSSPLIDRNTITANIARTDEAPHLTHGGGIYCYTGDSFDTALEGLQDVDPQGSPKHREKTAPTISNNTISGNICGYSGGGIGSWRSSPTIIGNTISDNYSDTGAGIVTFQGICIIAGNFIFENGGEYGGGIHCTYGSIQIFNNLIAGNTAVEGGGIHFRQITGHTSSNTIVDNGAGTVGNGIFCDESTVVVEDTILFGNHGQGDDQVYLGPHSGISSLTISYSDVQGGESGILLEPNCTLDWGDGMIDADPLFIAGLHGEYYLSQLAAGQAADSPCVDSGDPASQMIEGTTRTDLAPDTATIDMGYHDHLIGAAHLVAGPGPGYNNPPTVRVFPPDQGATAQYEFPAYGALQYGVKIGTGDVTGDNRQEILTGAGPGEIYGPHVRGFEVDGTPLPGLNFLAYGTNKYGVNVCAGDLDGDGTDEIITGAGPGAVFGPHVRGWIFNGPSGVTSFPGVSYFAYGTPKWGVNVSAGDIDGDGYDEIVTGAGPGAVYGPHVRGWNIDGNPSVTPIPVVSFFAYGTLKYGVNVCCGDVDGDGIDEIITGAGPGAVFGPHVRGWNFDGGIIAPLPGFSYFAWQTQPLSFGVNVAAGADLNGDGRSELVVGRGPDPVADTEVKVFTYDGETVSQWISLEAFSGLTHGTNVAAGRF